MSLRPNPILPAGAVAAIDRILEGQRDDLCVIERPSSGVDAGGAPASATFTAVQGVPCQVSAPARVAIEAASGGRFVPEADYEVRLPRETDVRSADRIVVKGIRLEVVSILKALSFGMQMIVAAKATG